MKDIKLDASCSVNYSARERFYTGSDNKALILIHGYTGYPGEMDYLGQYINKKTNYSVYIPRLPGHGTNCNDFRQSMARDWLRKIYDSYLNLKCQYNNITLAGLSMGGLLSILTAARFPIDKLILISAALYAKSKLLPLSYILKFFIPSVSNNLCPDPDDFDDNKMNLFQNYWKIHYTAQAAELHKLMRLARKRLSDISSDTLILASTKDKSVPLKAAYTIRDNIKSSNKKLIIFKESPHVINDGPEKQKCAKHIVDFLSI